MIITEGSATIEEDLKSSPEDKGNAFYNKVQVVNRDLSILVIQTFIQTIFQLQKKPNDSFQVLEALGATGLRSIRYSKEIDGITNIVCNDSSPLALETMRRNFEYNGISEGAIIANCDEANALMNRLSRSPREPRIAFINSNAKDSSVSGEKELSIPLQAQKMHVVDIDPYGSASPFLSAAISCVAEGGLLCVTCTDSAVLCGKYPETCHSKYGSASLKNCSYNHEMGLRILLAAIERSANLQGRYILPLLSLKIDFYFRVFVQLFTKPAGVKLSCTKMSHVIQCSQCSHFQLLPVARAQKQVFSSVAENSKDDSADSVKNGNVYLCSPEIPHYSGFAVSNSRLSKDSVFGWERIKEAYIDGNTSHCENTWCPSCISTSFTFGGPIYNQPIHDFTFVMACRKSLLTEKNDLSTKKMILNSKDRVDALLVNVLQELSDVPLYHSIPRMCSDLKHSVPPLPKVIDLVEKLGFRCSRSHCNVDALKTNAPSPVLYAVLKTLLESPDDIKRNTTGDKPLKLPHIKVARLLANINLLEESPGQAKEKPRRSVRYLPNPEKNWGPKSRAKQ